MKYIILNDFNYLIRKRSFLTIIAILISLAYCLVCSLNKNIVDEFFLEFVTNFTFSFKIFLIDNIKNNDIMTMAMIVINYGIFVLLAINIFKNDLSNFDNLLERISLNRWIDSKVIVNILCSFIITTIIYVLSKIIYPFLNINYLLIIKRTFVVSILTNYIYLLIISSKINIILFITFIIGMLGILCIPFDVRLMSMRYIILVFFIVIIILNLLCYFIKFSDIKE